MDKLYVINLVSRKCFDLNIVLFSVPLFCLVGKSIVKPRDKCIFFLLNYITDFFWKSGNSIKCIIHRQKIKIFLL